MKYALDDVLENLLVEAFSHLTYPELTERLAMFFRHYMPLSTLTFCVFFNRKIVKVSEYSYTHTLPGPDKIEVSAEALQKCMEEAGYNDDFDIHIHDNECAVSSIYGMLHPAPSTSLYVPLHYYKDRLLYMSITAFGRNRYIEDHVELCRLLRTPLAAVVGTVIKHQRIDLRDLAALEALEPYTEREVAVSSGPACLDGAGREHFPTLDAYMVEYIQRVLRHTRGRVAGKSGAAAILGLHVSTLWSKIRKFHIPVNRE